MNLARLFSPLDLVALGILGVLTLGAHAGIFEPARRASAEVQRQREALDERRRTLEERSAEVRRTRERVQRLRADLDARVTLEPASGISSRLAAIPELGAELGVLVRDVAPRPAQAGARFTTIPIVVGGECPPTSFTPFLAALRKKFPDMEITSFGVGARPESPDEPARFTIEMAWYTRAGGAGREGATTRPPAPTP